VTVQFDLHENDAYGQHLVAQFSGALPVHQGRVGVLTSDLPSLLADRTGIDAIMLSVDNAME
jgi:hypothetical protein